MGLLDRVKAVFTREQLPDDTKLLLSGVPDVHGLRRGLDEIVTRNEVELKEVEREIEKLAKIEAAEKEKIKSLALNEREKMNTLRYVKRLRRRMDSYDKRHKIHQDNIDLHLALLDRIDEMEAMELKAVKQEQIEEIAVDYEERLEKHKEIVAAGRVAQENEVEYDDITERRELEAIEKEILGAGEQAAKPEAEAAEPAAGEGAAKAPPRRVPIDEAMASTPSREAGKDDEEDKDDEQAVLDDRRLELE